MVKRIAILTDHSDPLAPLGGIEAGGENVYVLNLAKSLSRLGWTIDVFTRWSSVKTTQIAKAGANVRVIRLKAGPIDYVPRDQLFPLMPEYIKSFFEFREQNKLEYLLLHGNYYFSGWAGVQIAKKLHVPMVNTFHTLGVVRHMALGSKDSSPAERIKIEKELMDGADRLIATSPIMKDELIKYYEQPAKKIVVITEGVNPKRFIPLSQHLARRVLHISPNRLIILYVGRIERRKGIDTLLHAINQLARLMLEKRKILRLYITGGEPRRRWHEEKNQQEKEERDRLTAIVEELKIKDIVRFVGGVNRENLPFYYSACDVTVVPSYYEPFGLVPIESMSCGTPVIASRVGGMQWTIRDGKTGLLVTPRDPEAFADKIFYLLTHPLVKKKMRENGIERVHRMFSWELVAQQMSAFYKDLIIDNFYKQLFGRGSNGNPPRLPSRLGQSEVDGEVGPLRTSEASH